LSELKQRKEQAQEQSLKKLGEEKGAKERSNGEEKVRREEAAKGRKIAGGQGEKV
jgi:hypothetical protein